MGTTRRIHSGEILGVNVRLEHLSFQIAILFEIIKQKTTFQIFHTLKKRSLYIMGAKKISKKIRADPRFEQNVFGPYWALTTPRVTEVKFFFLPNKQA